MYVTVFNPSDSPVPLDETGRSIGGGEWAPAESTDKVTSEALADGRLVKIQQPEEQDERGINPDARTALDKTDAYSQRSEQLEGKDKAALLKIAQHHGLVGEDEDPLVADLRRTLVESDVDLSTPTSRANKSSATTAKPKDKE